MAIVYGDYPLKKKTNSSTVSGSGSQSSHDRRNGTADERYTPTAAPSKTIDDYKKDYAAAAARGDAAGMKAANDGANAIRTAQGQAAQVASNDIARVQSGGTSGMVSNPGRYDDGGYSGSRPVQKPAYPTPLKPDIGISKPGQTPQLTPLSVGTSGVPSYTQAGTDSYGKTIADYSRDYNDAKARGDAAGMQLANDRANAIRRAAGQQEQYATEDINRVAGGQYQQYYANNDLRGVGNLYLGTMATNERNLDAAEAAGNTIRLEDYLPNIVQLARNTGMDVGVAIDMFVNNIRNGRAVDGGDVGVDYAALQKQYNNMGAFNMNTEVNRFIREYKNNGLLYDPESALYGQSYGVGLNAGTGVTRDPVTGQLVPNPTGTAGQTVPFTGAGNGQSAALPTTVGTGTGGTAGSLSGYGINDYSDYIEAMNRYQQEAALAELRAAYEKNLAGLDRTQASIAPQYASARNQAAAQAAIQQQAFNEYAAANGLNTGVGGQAQLAFGNALQNDLSGINTAEANSMADLELQRSQAEIDYNNAIAQAQAEGNYQLVQQLYQEKVRVDEAYREMIVWQAEQDLARQQMAIRQNQWQQSFDASQNQYAQEQALQTAATLAQIGDFSGYKALGYSDDQIAAMTAYYQQSRTASEPVLSYSQMVSAIEAGNITPNVMQAYEYYMGTPWTNGTAALYQKSTGKSSRGGGGGSGMSMTLTTAKAMAEAKQFTDEVVDTFHKAGYNDAYLTVTYGYDPDKGQPDAQETGSSSGYYNLVANLSRLEDSSNASSVPSKAKALIQSALNAGSITEDDARKLLRQYGYAV